LLYGLVVFFSVMFTSDQMLTQIRWVVANDARKVDSTSWHVFSLCRWLESRTWPQPI
jgi:hypothetical protein